MRKWLYIFILSLLGFIPSISMSATLFDCDWGTATGTSNSAVGDGGLWTYVDNTPETWFEVFTTDGTPGSRNYIRVYRNTTGSGLMEATSGSSLNNPQDVYFRLWFRLYVDHTAALHAVTTDSSYGAGEYSFVFLDFRSDANGDYGPGIATSQCFWVLTDGIDYRGDGTWHRWEVRVQGAGGSSVTITALLDGVDVTNSLRGTTGIYDGNSISGWNGSLSCEAINYLGMQAYNQGGDPRNGPCVDLAGYKISTDGWIGGDESTRPCSISPGTSSSISPGTSHEWAGSN